MILSLIDDWKEPYSLLDAFQEAMRAKSKEQGEPSTEINIKDLPIGKTLIIEKDSD